MPLYGNRSVFVAMSDSSSGVNIRGPMIGGPMYVGVQSGKDSHGLPRPRPDAPTPAQSESVVNAESPMANTLRFLANQYNVVGIIDHVASRSSVVRLPRAADATCG